jgi:hypothetical protein
VATLDNNVTANGLTALRILNIASIPTTVLKFQLQASIDSDQREKRALANRLSKSIVPLVKPARTKTGD